MTYVKAECVLCAKFKGCDKSSPDITECADYRQTNEQTNEEWIKSCSTEELAEVVYSLVWLGNELFDRLECSGEDSKENDLKIVTEWLQEKHNDTERNNSTRRTQ